MIKLKYTQYIYNISINMNNKNIKDFINHILKFDNVDDILNTCSTQSEKGYIFERLFDIVIKFGYCDTFESKNYHNLIGNANNAKLKILENIEDYLCKKVCSSNSSGCSDTTLLNKNDNTFIFISSKYPKTHDDLKKQKSVDYYDIQNIIAVATKNNHIYKNYKIYLLVPNKKQVLDKVKSSKESSKYITEHITKDNILDKDDLNKYFVKFRQDMITNIHKDLNKIYFNKKTSLTLRFHQELIVQKTSILIERGFKNFLWACKCRSGKTFMVGGIIKKLHSIKNKLNVLVITPAPTETLPQFTNDLFNKFKEFNKFKIYQGIKSIDFLDSSSSNSSSSNDSSSNNSSNNSSSNNSSSSSNSSNSSIIIVSKQLLQKYTNNNTITKIKNLNLDIIVFDENHYSGTTSLSKDILNSYSSTDTCKIFLTATYRKPLQEWNILPECQMYWDIEDEQICKSILLDENRLIKLKEKHGDENIDSIIEYYTNLGYTISDIFKPYEKMPDLHIITNMFDNERYLKIKEDIMASRYGFSFDVLFSLNKNKRFNYENQVKIVLGYISGSKKETDYKTCDKSVFTRINNICSRHPYTQIWFLPSDNINCVSQNLKLLMLQDKILKNYSIMCINRQNNDLVKDIKDEIIKQELITKSEGKSGLILLAGNMLSLGITIDSCDIVILMNNTLSSDKIVQQMYRCMTEGTNKKCGFVVDLNISRVLQTCINYTVYKNSESIEDKIKYLINNHLINIDADMMCLKDLNTEDIFNKLMEIWKNDPINSFRTLLKNLDNDYVTFDNQTQKLLNTTFMNSVKDNKVVAKIVFNNGSAQELPTGKEIVKIVLKDTELTKDNSLDTKPDKEINISFTKDVLPHVIPLVCILTIHDKNKDFTSMLNYIKENKELLEIFDDQCLVWWNKSGLINIVCDIINKYFVKSSNTFNISVQFKLSVQSLLDRPKELVELINDCLKPKLVEKKTYGEVFTPLNFINDCMLKDLEDYWLKNKNEDIWTNEKLTWYDPTAGMGNFSIAIYYKLMDGLKNKIPNKEQRKKHVIEKQLYFGELNKKNCFIIKQIFNINNDYKLNLYEGDTLNISLNNIFKKNKFDIIIGNPPYNEELTRTGAKPLYNKFIEYYTSKCSILSFIVPSRWFSGGKGLDKFRQMMINRTDILYIKHYNDACRIFGNSVDIKGGVNYFLIDESYNGLCNYNGSLVKFSDFDIVLDSKYYPIVNRLLNCDKITKYYISQDYYKIQTNDKRLVDNKDNNFLKCYVSKQKGFIKYINKDYIKRNVSNFKVITARAAFGANSGFGNMFIGYSNEVHTKSYISFQVPSEIEAKSLLSYMKCKLPNFMLSLRKITQDINESTCRWIPLPPLNKEWTDNEIYEYFKLSQDEIKLVKNTKISGYCDISTNEQTTQTVKIGKKQYYSIGKKLYNIKKDNSLGKLCGKYINEKLVKDDKNKNKTTNT